MTVGELILINKAKYTKAYLLEKNEDNTVKFTQINDNTVNSEIAMKEAKDYFLLDKEGIEEIFGKSKDLEIIEEDKVLMIGL